MPRRSPPFRAIALFFAAFLAPSAARAQPQPPPPAAPPPALAPPLAQPVPPPVLDVPPPAAVAPLAPPPAPAPLPARPLPPPPAPDWGPPPASPPPAPIDGVSVKGLPLSQRGGIVADVAALRLSAPANSGGGQSNATPLATIDLAVHVPVLDHTFVDGNVPIALGAVGNPMVGMHLVFRVADAWWFNLGGAFGFPVISNASFLPFAQTKAFWDTQSFLVETVPFAIRFGVEGHTGLLEFRAQLDPVFGKNLADAPQANSFQPGGIDFVGLQHAIELQIGHAIGGGLRYQGVVSNLDFNLNNRELGSGVSVATDHYQGALEPFFRFYHDPIFFRLGLLLPLDAPLGTPFSTSWGARATVGFNLD